MKIDGWDGCAGKRLAGITVGQISGICDGPWGNSKRLGVLADRTWQRPPGFKSWLYHDQRAAQNQKSQNRPEQQTDAKSVGYSNRSVGIPF
ncbi:MAG: hypothetical protein ACLTWO_07375 [Blautia massiliensis (ex Durand et al. 2017)]